jgi:hypothetical protein
VNVLCRATTVLQPIEVNDGTGRQIAKRFNNVRKFLA